MRPTKLVLEGFTSFSKSAEINFDRLDLFAIVGQTGAGKSSILDAILYALYGRTPRISPNSVEELMNLSCSSMSVRLEFDSGSDRYCATRTRKKMAKKSPSDFRLEKNGVPLLDTEIKTITGLDFDGFTRAVILPQGEFDEFLRGDAKKRTEILKDLLNLRIYEEMMRKANAEAAIRKAEAESKQKDLDGRYKDATIERRIELATAINQKRAEEREAQALIEALEVIENEARELRTLRGSRETADSERSAAEKELHAKTKDAASAEAEIQKSEQRVKQAESQLASVRFDENAWTQLLQVAPLVRQVASLQSEVASERRKKQSKESELPVKEQQLQEAEVRLNTVRSALTEAETERKQCLERYGTAKSVRELHAALQRFHAPERAKADADAALQEAETLLRKLQQTNAAEALRQHLHAGDMCPVCEQTIQQLPQSESGNALKDAERALAALRAAAATAHTDYVKWKALADKAAAMGTSDLEGLASRLEEMDVAAACSQTEFQAAQKAEQEARAALSIAQVELRNLETNLETRSRKLREAGAEMQKYPEWAPMPADEIEAELEEQNSRKLRRDGFNTELQSAKKQYEELLKRSNETRAKQLALQSSIEALRKKVLDLAGQIDGAQEKLRPRIEGFFAQPGIDEYSYLETKRKLEQKRKEQLVGQVAAETVKLEQLERDIKAAEALREGIAAAKESAEVYRKLGYELQSNRFVAFVQRQLLARLAQTASHQLKSLSDGRYTLTLEDDGNEFSVFDLWNGGLKRSSKTLSGGESFLASLSLALALSDSIAAFGGSQGIRLDSLFLDEGFSTLDADNLRVAIDAVQTLAATRRMVGIISHLPEIATELRARIIVEKSPSGSTIRIDRDEDHSHSMVAGGL